MSNNQVAFWVGLFGSVHCIGMCGPLAFVLPASGTGGLRLLFDKLVYQLGRMISYSLLGLIVGLVGRQILLLGLQKGISIVSGILILGIAINKIIKCPPFYGRSDNRLFATINKAIGYALKHKWGHLFVGILNGFLPCGFVYLALVGALNTNSATLAAMYMAWFGFGTLPLMLLASIGAGFITTATRIKLNRVVPYFMACLGLWFILRASSLNIPYLSPAISATSASTCK